MRIRKAKIQIAVVVAVLVTSLFCGGLTHAGDDAAVLTSPEQVQEAEALGIAQEQAQAAAEAEAAQKAAKEAEALRIAQEQAQAAAEAEAAQKAAEEAEALRIAQEQAQAAAEAEAAQKVAEEAEALRVVQEQAQAAAEAEAAQKAAEEADAGNAQEQEQEQAQAAAEAEAARKAAEEAEAGNAQEQAQEQAQAAAEAAQKAAEEAEAGTAQEQAQAAEVQSAEEPLITEEVYTPEAPEPEAVEVKQTDVPENQMVTVTMDRLPLPLKAQLSQTLTAGSYYEMPVEIETAGAMEAIKLSLRSGDPRYVITSYHTVDEAGRGIREYGIVTEGEAKNDERIFRLQAVAGGSKIKTDPVIIYVLQDIQIAQGQTLPARVMFEIIQGGTCYVGNDIWGIEPLPGDPADSSEEQTGSPDDQSMNVTADEPIESTADSTAEEPAEKAEEIPREQTETAKAPEHTEAENVDEIAQEQTETAQQSDSVTETSGTEQKAVIQEPEQISPVQTAAVIPEEAAPGQEEGLYSVEDEEMVTMELIPDEEGEDPDAEPEEDLESEEGFDDFYYEDGGYYYDDWVSYSSYEEGTVINTATPYVLVKSYSHKRTIYTGDAFGVEIEFLNTSQKAAMDNVVVKVETSEALSLASGTNTLFINGIEAGGTNTQKLNLLAAAECKEQTQKLTFTVSFEYIENKERKKGEASETITLPIVQKDRLEVKDPVYDEMQAGTEGVISVSYVNKGFTSLYNMEATLNLENADAVQKSVYAGNVESGKSGTLDFLITPEMDGEYMGTVTLTYEDSAQKEVSVVIPLEFDVMTAYVQDDFSEEEVLPEEEYEEKAASMPWILMIAGAAAIILGSTILVVLKKRKAKADQDVDLDDWFRETGDKK